MKNIILLLLTWPSWSFANTCPAMHFVLHESTSSISTGNYSIMAELFKIPTAPVAPYTRLHETKSDVTGQNQKVLILDQGQYENLKGREVELLAQGYYALAIKNPSPAEVAQHPDFLLTPSWVFWSMPRPASVEDWIAGLKSSAKNQVPKKLRKSDEIFVDVQQLTFADYVLWQTELFEKEIMGKKSGAIRAWGPVEEFAATNKLPFTGNLADEAPGFYRAFYYTKTADGGKGQLVGGIIIQGRQDIKTLVIRGAAFEQQARSQYDFAVRSVATLIDKSRWQHVAGFDLEQFSSVSYGSDPNIWGIDSTFGLLQSKVNLGMQPVVLAGDLTLLKILNFDQIRRQDQLPTAPNRRAFQGLAMFVVRGSGIERVEIANGLLPNNRDLNTLRAATTQVLDLYQLGADSDANNASVPKDIELKRQ